MYAKKHCRFVICIMIIVAISVSICCNSYAASAPWPASFSSFTTIAQGTSNSGYAAALQRFLQCYSSDTNALIMDHGGVDGSFGAATKSAVKIFQLAKGLTDDGVVGSNTWRAIGASLNMSSSVTAGQTVYLFWSNLTDTSHVGNQKYVIRVSIVSGDTYYYYNYYNGNGSLVSPSFQSVN